MSQSPDSRNSNIETRIERPRSVVDVIRGVALTVDVSCLLFVLWAGSLRVTVEFLLKTDSGYPRDAEVTLFTLANPEHSLRFNTHWSAPHLRPRPFRGT